MEYRKSPLINKDQGTFSVFCRKASRQPSAVSVLFGYTMLLMVEFAGFSGSDGFCGAWRFSTLPPGGAVGSCGCVGSLGFIGVICVLLMLLTILSSFDIHSAGLVTLYEIISGNYV